MRSSLVSVNAVRAAIVALVVLLGTAGLVHSAGGKGHGKGKHDSGKDAAAKKQAAIQRIEAQLAQARQVLKAAQSQIQMSSNELDAVRMKISYARKELEAVEMEQRNTAVTLQEIENRLVAEQEPDSKVVRARDQMEEARDEFDKLRTAGTSSESLDYRTAGQRLVDAKREFEKLKLMLCEQDAEWVAARDHMRIEKKREAEAVKNANPQSGALGSQRKLENAQQVAAAAQEIIDRGQAQLRALGVKKAGPGPKKGKKRK